MSASQTFLDCGARLIVIIRLRLQEPGLEWYHARSAGSFRYEPIEASLLPIFHSSDRSLVPLSHETRGETKRPADDATAMARHGMAILLSTMAFFRLFVAWMVVGFFLRFP